MLHGFLVGAAFFGGELAGAFVKLRGHFGGLLRRTAEDLKSPCKLGKFYGHCGGEGWVTGLVDYWIIGLLDWWVVGWPLRRKLSIIH